MKKVLVTVAALAAFTATAFAGQVEGKVQAVDAAARTITLEDGSSYVAAEGVAIDALAAGDTVAITFDDGTTNATAVEKK
jgi:hypothetical protein